MCLLCAAWLRAIPWCGNTRIQFSRMVLLCSWCHPGRVRKSHVMHAMPLLHSLLSVSCVHDNMYYSTQGDNDRDLCHKLTGRMSLCG